MTGKDRRKQYEERLKAAGLVKVTVWCSPECAANVKRIAAESRKAVADDG